MLEQQRDEQPPHAPVAVQVRVNGLELYVDKSRTDERRERVFAVDVPLQLTE